MSTTRKIMFVIVLLLWLVRTEDDDHDHDHDDDHDHDHQDHENMLTEAQIWGFGFLGGLAVSLIGFFAAILVVLIKRCGSDGCFEVVVKFLFALGCGALVGDVMVHMLPESFGSEHTEANYVALTFICSLMLFLIIEKIFESCGISHSHWTPDEDEKKEEGRQKLPNQSSQINMKDSIKFRESMKVQKVNPETQEGEVEEKEEKGFCQSLKGKGSAGYLNLIGSLIHNFIDGLAVGIAFATGNPEEIIPVLVAIIAHEIPREMGDVAIMMKNNFTGFQTIICNGTVNLISLVGLFIGLAVQHLEQGAKLYLLVFISGNFMYIAADIWRHLLRNKGAFWKNILEVFGFSLGVGAMYLLLLTETGDHNH